jgi:hypothetical protein
MNFTAGQQIESDEVMKRLGQLEYRNHGGMARMSLFDEGKALITSGLRVTAGTGLTVNVATGTLYQREIDVTGCIQKDIIPVTMDAASGAPRTDIVECQIKMVADKDDYSRIGTVATGGSGGSVIITNEEIQRDLRYYVSARKKTSSTTPTAATSASVTGTVAMPGTVDLSEEYLINISDGEDGDWEEVDCRGAVPNATTRAEIMAAINAALGRTAATAGSGDVIVITGNGTGEGSFFSFKPPVTNSDADGLEAILGLSIGGLYKYEYRGDNSWIKLCEIDMGASTTTITDALIRNIDQKDTWTGEINEVIVKRKIFTINEPDWNEWSSIRTYGAGDIAYIGDIQFVSLVGSNLNKDPLFQTDWWMPSMPLTQLLHEFQKGVPQRGGMNDIHNIRDAGYQQNFNMGKYKLGTRTLQVYGVHIDGTTVTGDATLEGILSGYHFIDLFAPDTLGTRTLLNYQGRVPRVVTSASGGTGDSLAVSLVQEDQFQGHILFIHPTNAYFKSDGNVAGGANAWTTQPTGGSNTSGAITTDGTNGTPRTGLETRMKNWSEGVPFFIVVKSV